ncbi:DNA cytosine methyltransferase [Aquabacter spiritensis]|uniref:Cytosine-specific methyltransferase n=1 Tax=Aquabacter spiritensis TaxID=933073 RepID=A0A4V2UXH6_9HYPH|nr:DNA cytosine methyltransferase [Aquabacter spiritensis]TCT03538.1 DNA (cytosine-5)-methyltransferase 1 [Aquabacter spiritensis]
MKHTSIDLFSGAGGLSLGLECAGFESLFAVDTDADAIETYQSVFPDAKVHNGDIRDVDFREWRGIDLIAGGPPCQPFSIGGLRRAWDDHRDMLPEFVRVVREVQPRAFIMENVPGLVSFSSYLATVMAPLSELYRIFGPQVFNAADYGVPQSRRRMIIVGIRDAIAFRFPEGDHTLHVPAGTVLTSEPLGRPNPSKIVFARNPDLRPNPYHGQLFNGGGRPIDLKRPAPTILASAGGNKTHFLDLEDRVPRYHRYLALGGAPYRGELSGARRLTVAESAALQSFPPQVQFAGRTSSQYRQVGNAVPPKVAQAIGNSLMEQVFSQSVRRKRVAA